MPDREVARLESLRPGQRDGSPSGGAAPADPSYLELTELAALIRTREISPVAATRAQLDRIAALDGAFHSYALVTADSAMAQAEAAEADIAAGRYRGPLHGVPVAVEDLFWAEGIPTAAGTAIHRDHRPAEDATAVRRLKDAGAVLLGKLQTTEGACPDHHPTVTPPRSPWSADHRPDISSSGPGVAIATGLCYGALASDTGGSIRWPAAANGLTGLKPSWGRISRHGVLALAPTLDHIGPMARSTADIAVMLGAVAGADPADPTALLAPVPYCLTTMGRGVQGLRIGVDPAWNGDGVDAATRAVLADAATVFDGLGAEIVEVRCPDVTQPVADWSAACAVEAAVTLADTYPARKDEYGPALASVIEAGRALSGVDHQRILLRRQDLRGRFAALFGAVDMLLTPVRPTVIRAPGGQPERIAGLQRYTCPFNLTGQPALTLPGGVSEAGLPIGFQLVAAHLGEMTLLRAGAVFQTVTSWHRRHPTLPQG